MSIGRSDEKTPVNSNHVKAPKRPKTKMRKSSVDVRPRKSLLSAVLSSAHSSKSPSDPQNGNEESASKKRAPKTCPLDMLPDEVLGHAFFSGYVNSIDITTKITMLSKRTRQVANKSVKMLDLRALPKLEAHHVAAIVARHGNVSALDFGYCCQFGRQHLLALVPVSGTLRELCLRGTNLSDDDIVAYLDAVMEHLGGEPSGLEELDLSTVKKEESPRIGDVAVSKIVVSRETICIYLLLLLGCGASFTNKPFYSLLSS